MSCTNIPLITDLLGYIFMICFKIAFNKYLLAIIVFTVVTRLIVLPFSIKQQKGTVTMARLKPKTDALNKKYGSDKTKLNEETMKLYKQENYNPMSGCLPMAVQMLILFGLIGVIYNPLQYVLHVDKDDRTEITRIVSAVKNSEADKSSPASQMSEINMLSDIKVNDIKLRIDKLNSGEGDITYFIAEKNDEKKFSHITKTEYDGEEEKKLVLSKEEVQEKENDILIDLFIKRDKNAETVYSFAVDEKVIEEVKNFSGQLKVFGLNFGEVPRVPFSEGGSWSNLLWIIPLLTGITSFLTSFISTKLNPAQSSGNDAGNPMGGSMKMMMYIFPVMSLSFAFSMPAGMGFYWTCSSVVAIAQTLLLNKFYNPKKILAQIEAEEAKKPSNKQQKKQAEEKRIETTAKEKESGKDLSDFDE